MSAYSKLMEAKLKAAEAEIAAKDAVIEAAREVTSGMTSPNSWEDDEEFIIPAWTVKALVIALHDVDNREASTKTLSAAERNIGMKMRGL